MLDDNCRSGVAFAGSADLRVETYAWAFETENSDAIDRNWRAALAANPSFFNGDVYLTSRASIENGVVAARLFKTDFKTVLYWRELGYPETGVIDGFGSALIHSADGAYIFCRQRPGQINSGMTYLPGGFIDGNDVLADGRIDISRSILRELEEETGLGPADGAPAPGFILTRAEYQLSYALTFNARATAADLIRQIKTRLDADPKSELQDVIEVRSLGDLAGAAMPPYARMLAARMLPP